MEALTEVVNVLTQMESFEKVLSTTSFIVGTQ